MNFLDILVQKNVISHDKAVQLRAEFGDNPRVLEEALLAQKVPEGEIVGAKAEILGVPVRKIKEAGRISFDILKNLPEESARYYQAVLFNIKDGALEAGMVNPEDTEAKEALRFISSKLGLSLKIYLISVSDFDAVLKEYRGLGGEAVKVLGELESILSEEKLEPAEEILKGVSGKFVEEAPITKLTAVIIKHATESRASDIHIEPMRDNVRVRFRIDGVLHSNLLLPLGIHEAVVSRIKVLTNMKLDEKRRPQDGRFSAKIGGRDVDFRVSTFPITFGEKVVMRILDPQKGIKTLEELGIWGYNLESIKEGLKAPYGMILLTGPTGSGKTTTLYSMLRLLDRETNNVVSLEDPVEYLVEGVSQSQVKPEIGYDFAIGLRHIVRQDPDIILVGEIRDAETAKLAVQAALTGHLVLSTLHTNNAVGVIPRLIDMGIEPYLIPSTLILAIAQRLVPTLCPDSKKPIPVKSSVKEMLEKEISQIPESTKKTIKIPGEVYQPLPSPTCPRGLSGRLGVFEVLKMTDELKQIIYTNPTEADIFKEGRRQGMITMREDGIVKAIRGLVSLEDLSEII
jgi:type IV pilus assembly protein PilB